MMELEQLSKKCTKCGELKPISEFSRDVTKTDGHRNWCKICHQKWRSEYHERNQTSLSDEQKENLVRWCFICGLTKPLIEFRKHKNAKDGHGYECIPCSRKRNKKYNEQNKEKLREKNRAWRKANPEKVRESYRRFREKNPDYWREWAKKNYHKLKAQDRERSFLYGKSNDIPRSGLLNGDGCCLYCGEINPFFLQSHHPFGKEVDFTITLCANHHAPFRRFPKILEDWGELPLSSL